MKRLVLAAAQSTSKRGDIKTNIKNHLKLIETAAEQGAQLTIFPELSLTGYEPDLAETHALTPTDPRLTPLQTTADKHQTSILAGAPYKSPVGTHIAAFLYTPNQEPQIYTKHHLHPGEEKHFTPGTKKLTINISQTQISPAICADIAHPEHASEAAAKGSMVYAAGVMITPQGYANDAGLLQSYAEKHGITVLLSNYASATGGYPSAGRSAVWDEHGRLMAQAPESGEAIVLCTIMADTAMGKVITI
jgi:predicted amidohydrolase